MTEQRMDEWPWPEQHQQEAAMILELYQVGEADAKGLEHQAARIRQETQAKARQRYEALAKRAFAKPLPEGWAVGTEGVRVPVQADHEFQAQRLKAERVRAEQARELADRARIHGPLGSCLSCGKGTTRPLCNACDLARRVAEGGEQSNEHATP